MSSYLQNLTGVEFFAFLIRSFKKIQIINLLPQLFYERISAEVFNATTFHGLSCRRCTGHPSCRKRYRRDSNTDYISVGQISNLMRYHYSTIPYLIIHHLSALCETHGQYNHPLNIYQGFCKTLLFYLYSLNFIQIKLWILTFNVWALFFELYSTYIWILD